MSYWEIIFSREVALSLRQKPDPTLNEKARPDTSYLNYLQEENPHTAPDYAVPLGLNEGKNNLALLLKLRNGNLTFLRTTSFDLRSYFISPTRPNVHQIFLNIFGIATGILSKYKK